MSASELVAKLGVKITYSFNDSPQLRLARHPPTEVTVYEDEEAGSTATSPTKKTHVGRFAELPLRICLSALRNASPELLSNVSLDYSIYVNDPTEATESSPSGVLVGKGLLSWGLEDPPRDPDSTVFGKVVKDGIRGQSVLVNLVLEKTTRMLRESAPAQLPSEPKEASRVGSHPPVQHSPLPAIASGLNPNNANMAALLSLLSSASHPASQAPAHPHDINQLLSAFAGCYNLGIAAQPLPTPSASAQTTVLSVPGDLPSRQPTAPLPASTTIQVVENLIKEQPVSPVIKEEEQEIVEIPCLPSSQPVPPPPTSSTPVVAPAPKPKKPSSDKENVPIVPVPGPAAKASLKSPSDMSALQAKPAPALPTQVAHVPMPQSALVSSDKSRNQTPFIPVPALRPGTVTAPIQPLLPLLGHSYIIPPFNPKPPAQPTKKRRKQNDNSDNPYATGPNGNGWYRRTALPPVPSSDAIVPPSDAPSEIDVSVVDSKGKGKKRPSDVDADAGTKKKRKKSKDTPVVPATSPLKAVSNVPKVKASASKPVPVAATSPIRPSVTVKRLTLKTKAVEPAPVNAVLSKPACPPEKRAPLATATALKDGEADKATEVPKVRMLNFLSLTARPFLRTQSESAALSQPSTSLAIPTPHVAHTNPPALAVPADALSTTAASVAALSLPTPPASQQEIIRPSTPKATTAMLPPQTPARQKVIKPRTEPRVEMETEDDDDASPLFLPSPEKTQRVRATVEPCTPTRASRRKTMEPQQQLEQGPSTDELEMELNLDYDSDEEDATPHASQDYSSVVATAPIDYSALGLPPSSPPSSFASSSPDASPRFTLDSVADGVDEDSLMEESLDPEADMDEEEPLGDTSNLPQSDATIPSSTMVATSDAPMPGQMDFSALLGLCENVAKPANNTTEAFDFWNALGISGPAEAASKSDFDTNVGVMHPSDIFDFSAAGTVESHTSPVDETVFDSLLDAL